MMKLSCVTCLLLVGESANMYLRIKLNQLLIFDYRPTLIMMTYSCKAKMCEACVIIVARLETNFQSICLNFDP